MRVLELHVVFEVIFWRQARSRRALIRFNNCLAWRLNMIRVPRKRRPINSTHEESENHHQRSRADLQVRGIYELKNDGLKICIRSAGGNRPTEFMAETGSKCLLFVLKRGK